MRYSILWFFLFILFTITCFGQKSSPGHSRDDSGATEEVRNDLKKFYDEYNVDGVFALYDPLANKYIFYNKSLYHQEVTPASTFNIISSLIALDEKIIDVKNSIIKWNGRHYNNAIARQDLDLETAFKYNIDWYFWRLRLKIGGKKMKYWLNKIQYGNNDVSGTIDSFRVTSSGVDSFWVVSGTLRITPAQQLDFIKKFYYEQLPFSKQSMNIVKELLFEKDTAGYKIYGKRGSYRLPGENKYIGWFVGYVKTKTKVYFFVNYIQSPDLNHHTIVDAQKNIPFAIFTALNLGNKN